MDNDANRSDWNEAFADHLLDTGFCRYYTSALEHAENASTDFEARMAPDVAAQKLMDHWEHDDGQPPGDEP